MPYIPQSQRQEIDPAIDQLIEQMVSLVKKQDQAERIFPGVLNYVCTRIALGVAKGVFGRMRYFLLASLAGVFSNISSELYRRVAAPYEDEKIISDGDLDEFD
ncbi:MAG: hypothetical protein AAFV78_17260 [Bacteroidota bacterium]